MTTMSAREFNRDVSAAKRAARKKPLVITDRGNPAFILMSIDQYDKLRQPGAQFPPAETGESLLDRLSMSEEIEFEPTPLTLKLREVEF